MWKARYIKIYTESISELKNEIIRVNNEIEP